MRIVALITALAFAMSSAPVAVAPPSASREDALVALCRLWNALRFTHPALASESHASWDDALLAAEPIVERDPSALRAAAAAMLATLQDSATVLDAETRGAPVKPPVADEHDGVRVVHLNGYPNEQSYDAYSKALAAALTVAATERALVVDCAPARPSADQIELAEYLWSRSPLVARTAGVPVRLPELANRYFQGFPPEAGMTSGDYREGRETIGTG